MVIVPPTETLDIFTNSPRGARQKEIYDRYQCRMVTLQLVPQDRLSNECLQFICRVAGLIYGRGMECECDPTGSISGICKAGGGQCDCKPNVMGRK